MASIELCAEQHNRSTYVPTYFLTYLLAYLCAKLRHCRHGATADQLLQHQHPTSPYEYAAAHAAAHAAAYAH